VPNVGRLTQAHVGGRVVVRYRLPQPTQPTQPTGPTFTDVVGLLESFDDTALAVRDRRGRLVRVPLTEVFLAKPVPPARRQSR
jgi:hypothetical protein